MFSWFMAKPPVFCLQQFSYPYFGPNLPASSVKFGADETYVSFGSSFEVDKHPFESASLWDSLFPMKNWWFSVQDVPLSAKNLLFSIECSQ